MSLLKIPLICFDAVNMRINATPPNPPRPVSEHIIPNWRERFLRTLGLPCILLRTTYWMICLIEVIIILAGQRPNNLISNFILSLAILNGASPDHIRISPLSFFGTILTLWGTFIRVSAYRTLGRYFTFELSLQKDHKLVVSGPYSFVRHPSYTGLIMSVLGAYLNHASNGSWVRECGALDWVVGKALAIFWIGVALAVVVSLVLRVENEDRMLKERFGQDWTDWTKEVPWKLVPWVY
ncbi:hypothetical protein AX16_006256 [Volvariella volvacea WC 439]|nr:hypothetical protein AX16_006256 [Volvariella volvacea WC 439]